MEKGIDYTRTGKIGASSKMRNEETSYILSETFLIGTKYS